MSAVQIHAATQWARHVRSPALTYLALLAPLVAVFLIPSPDAGYNTIGINEGIPAATPAVIGLTLGVVTATLLVPLAYIYLRAGPTARQPVSAQVPTPARRTAQFLGDWMGDVAALWAWLSVLGLAGIILATYRTGLFAPIEVLSTLFISAAPSLALIAAIRRLFAARPALRGWGGDVAFFFVWMILVALSAGFMTANGSAIMDVFGYAAPMQYGTDTPLYQFTMPAQPGLTTPIAIDALGGVLTTDYLLSRLFWLGAAAALAALAGLIHKPSKPRPQKARPHYTPQPATRTPVAPIAAEGGGLDVIKAQLRDVFTQRLWIIGLAVAAVIGVVFPLSHYAGPAIALALLFPLSAHSGLWRAMSPELSALPNSASDLPAQALAYVGIAVVVLIPGVAMALARGDLASLTVAALLATALPLAILALGWVTRGAVAARVLGFIAVYIWLNMMTS